MVPATIERWHEVVRTRDLGVLDTLLADDVVFLSPVMHTPQAGKALTTGYLRAALNVLNNDSFRYLGAWYGTRSAVLEFGTVIDGVQINGVDIIEWNAAGQIVRFKVMVRPLKAINLLHQMMGQMLAKLAAGDSGVARPQ
jgi:hypothetical protein